MDSAVMCRWPGGCSCALYLGDTSAYRWPTACLRASPVSYLVVVFDLYLDRALSARGLVLLGRMTHVVGSWAL